MVRGVAHEPVEEGPGWSEEPGWRAEGGLAEFAVGFFSVCAWMDGLVSREVRREYGVARAAYDIVVRGIGGSISVRTVGQQRRRRPDSNGRRDRQKRRREDSLRQGK